MYEKRVLLVEDNQDDEFLALRVLRKNSIKCQVIRAHDGVEALEYLNLVGEDIEQNTELLPHIILLDLNLPRINGLEFLRRLRDTEFGRMIPVVIFTSSLEPHDLIASYQLGANSYIRKPIDFGEFNLVADQILRYWLVTNQLPPATALAEPIA